MSTSYSYSFDLQLDICASSWIKSLPMWMQIKANSLTI